MTSALAECCTLRPRLLVIAFNKALLTLDLAWLDQVLEHEFEIGFELVVKIRDREFRNQVLERLFGWWLDKSGKWMFLRFLQTELGKCIKALARTLPEGKRRFVRGTKLDSRARDLRYMYAFGLLHGAEPDPPSSPPNYSFLKSVGKPCRRIAAATSFPPCFLLPDLVKLVVGYLFI